MEIILGTHYPYEMGWDAWVALGTLFLGAVTIAAVLVPARIEARKSREAAGAQARSRRLFALSLVNEFAAASAALPSVREMLADMADEPCEAAVWTATNVFSQRVALPVLFARLHEVQIFDLADAEALVLAFASLTQLHEATAQIGIDVEMLARKSPTFAPTIWGIAAHTQKYVDDAYSRMWREAGRTNAPPRHSHAALTDAELAMIE